MRWSQYAAGDRPSCSSHVCLGHSSGLYVDGQAPDHIKDLQWGAGLTVLTPQHTAYPACTPLQMLLPTPAAKPAACCWLWALADSSGAIGTPNFLHSEFVWQHILGAVSVL